MTRSVSAAGMKFRAARRGRKAAVGGLLVLLALPLWLTTLPAQEPDEEESRRIIARAEQQIDGARRDMDNIERDFNSKLIERDNSVIPLVQKASVIASQARPLANRLMYRTNALQTVLTDLDFARERVLFNTRLIEALLRNSDCQARIWPT